MRLPRVWVSKALPAYLAISARLDSLLQLLLGYSARHMLQGERLDAKQGLAFLHGSSRRIQDDFGAVIADRVNEWRPKEANIAEEAEYV